MAEITYPRHEEWIGLEFDWNINRAKGLTERRTVVDFDKYGHVICVNESGEEIRLLPTFIERILELRDGPKQKEPSKVTTHTSTRVKKEKPVIAKVAKPAAEKTVTTHAATGGSKREQAIELYGKLVGKSRKEVIEAFVTDLGMTPAGASTYYQNCKSNWCK